MLNNSRKLLSIVADFLAITQPVFNWLERIAKINNEKYLLTINIVCIIFALFCSTYIIYVILAFLVRNRLKKCGTHEIPCELYNYAYYKLLNHNRKILNAFHRDMYHRVHDIRKSIKEKRITKRVDISDEMDKLLRIFHATLFDVFHLDVSISVKLIEKKDDKVLLKSYKFFSSREERNNPLTRNVENIYLLAKDSSRDLSVYALKAREYNHDHGNREYKRNNIYDYILSTSNNSWMSNDLSLDEQNNLFFTSSDNYSGFYKSLAAFAILPPNCTDEMRNRIKGVLTFDSSKTGVFSEQECNLMMGMMAHYLYEILEKLN